MACAPTATVTMNPLSIRTERGLGHLGALIRQWCLDPATRPESVSGEAGRVVMDVETFREIMKQRGLTEGDPENRASGDYALRPDIREVELIERGAGRATIVLPEEPVVRALSERAPQGIEIELANIYKAVSSGPGYGGVVRVSPVVDSDKAASYTVRIGGDVLEGFVDPHMAFYTCSQCS